jgi:photosystem II stability/assembly factor-like uncharacterized protein
MKRILCCFVLFLIAFTTQKTVLAQTGVGDTRWQFSNPKPFGFWGSQLSYADDNNVLIVGEAGGIAKSTDGGGTWAYFSYTVANSMGATTQPTLNDVHFINSNVAYAVGTEGIVIKSTDGGINWNLLQTPFFAQGKEVHSVFFTHADTGFIVGAANTDTRRATLYRTVDAGATWQSFYEFPEPDVSWFSGDMLKIRFTPSGTGYVTGTGGGIFKYSSGSWTKYSLSRTNTVYANVNAIDTLIRENFNGGFDTIVTNYDDNIWGLHSNNYRLLTVLNDSVIITGAQNNGGLIRLNTSTPAGYYHLINNNNAIHPKYAPIGSTQFYNAVNKDANTIWSTTSYGDLLTSTDGGYHWTGHKIYPVGTFESNLDIWGIALSPGGRLGVCGARGMMADSIAGQWRRPYKVVTSPNGSGIDDVHFFDADYGVVCGGGGLLQRTSNSGDTWEDVSISGFSNWDYLSGVQSLTRDTIVAVASNGGFYKSGDRGSTMDLLFQDPKNANFNGVHFLNKDTGWIVANQRLYDNINYVDTTHNVIYHTYDGGNTWDTSLTSFPYQTGWTATLLNQIQFFNANLGFAIGTQGTIYKSVDGGINWVKVTALPTEANSATFYSLDIADANTVFVTGDGVILKSTDAGTSWELINNGLQGGYVRYNKILAYNPAMLLVFSGNKVYSSKNAGSSWDVYYAPVADMLTAAAFAPLANCSTGICKKVFAGGVFKGNILKLDAAVVLPVKMGALTGTGTPEGNQLFWTAFAQENVKHFEVERSTNGTRFTKIGDDLQPGAFARQSYQWLDALPVEGTNYYRVKAVERDGAVIYTNIVAINGKKAVKWNYYVAQQNLVVNNVKVDAGMINISLLSQTGQTVVSKTWNHAGGAFNQLLQLPTAVNGIYLLRITSNGQSVTHKVFIQQ